MLQRGKFRRWQLEDLTTITSSLSIFFCLLCACRSKSGAISVELVPESRYCDVLDHITPIFLRDEPLSQCFPPCTTGQRERDFREYAVTQLRSGFCVMALDGSTVVGTCLNRPLTRDQVMGYSMPSSDGSGMGLWNYNLLNMHMYSDILLYNSNKKVGELRLVGTRQTLLPDLLLQLNCPTVHASTVCSCNLATPCTGVLFSASSFG
jgi:hypothetical protein